MTLAVAGCLLVASLVVSPLADIDPQHFERVPGDPVTEYQIVAKEGFELLGWSVVALALWDGGAPPPCVCQDGQSTGSPGIGTASPRRAA